MTHIPIDANLALRPYKNPPSFQMTLRANGSCSQKVLRQALPSYMEGDWSAFRLGVIINPH